MPEAPEQDVDRPMGIVLSLLCLLCLLWRGYRGPLMQYLPRQKRFAIRPEFGCADLTNLAFD